MEIAKAEDDNILANSQQESDVEMNGAAEEPELEMTEEGAEGGEDEMVEEQGESEMEEGEAEMTEEAGDGNGLNED